MAVTFPCEHDTKDELEMSALDKELGYRIIAHSSQDGHPGQLQNLDMLGHVRSCRPASNVEVQLYALLAERA